MARMPASTPLVEVRAPDWLPAESISVLSYCGAATAEAIRDALMRVDVDMTTSGVKGATYTSGNAATVRRRLAVKGWSLFEEDPGKPGVAGKAIPFNPENVDNLDPLYAAYLDTQILELWNRWRTVTGQDANGSEKEVAQARKPFSPGPATLVGGDQPQDSQEAKGLHP